MRAGSGTVQTPTSIATFRDSVALRSFLSPFARTDPLNLMVDNKLSFEGNMSYLGRLGHLTAVVAQPPLAAGAERSGEPGDADGTRPLHVGDVAGGEAAGDAALRAHERSRRPRRPLSQPLHPRRLPPPQGDARRVLRRPRRDLHRAAAAGHGVLPASTASRPTPRAARSTPSCGRPARSTTSSSTRSRSSATAPCCPAPRPPSSPASSSIPRCRHWASGRNSRRWRAAS